MGIAIGNVNFLVGEVAAVAADGSERALNLGDTVMSDDVIRPAAGAEIEISLLNGDSVVLADGDVWSGVDNLSPDTLAVLQVEAGPIATVNAVSGEVIAVAADGTERVLEPGDQIFADETIRTSPDASVELIAIRGNGEPIVLENGQSWLASADAFTPASNQVANADQGPIGTVNSTSGVVVAVDAEGNERVLQPGDAVFADETIQTTPDGFVELSVLGEDGQPVVVADGQSWLATSDTYTPESQFDPTTAAASDIDAAQLPQVMVLLQMVVAPTLYRLIVLVARLILQPVTPLAHLRPRWSSPKASSR